MEYIILTSNTSALIVDLVGKNIASQALLDTSNKIYNILCLVYDYNNKSINSKLIDLESQIKVIESLILDINTNINNKSNSIINNKFNSIELCINTINDIINNIHNTLNKLYKDLLYHNTKWFNKYRTIDYSLYLDDLNNYKLQLDVRLDLLIKILTIISFI
jgi:hypothetical protein